jgi:phage-related protein
MPATKLIFFREADGTAPVVEWLTQLRRKNPRAYAKCRVRLMRLAEMGHELRRPEADYLRDGIYELRSRLGSVNYRVLYFFHGRNVAIVAHGLTKEDEVPNREIEQAIKRRTAFLASPTEHSFTGDVS